MFGCFLLIQYDLCNYCLRSNDCTVSRHARGSSCCHNLTGLPMHPSTSFGRYVFVFLGIVDSTGKKCVQQRYRNVKCERMDLHCVFGYFSYNEYRHLLFQREHDVGKLHLAKFVVTGVCSDRIRRRVGLVASTYCEVRPLMHSTSHHVLSELLSNPNCSLS